MPDETDTYSWVPLCTRSSVILWVVCLALAAAVTLAGVLHAIITGCSWMYIALLAAALIATVAAGLWAVAVYGAVRVVVDNERAVRQAGQRLSRIESLMESQSASLKRLIELASLSDQAKSLVFREAEIEAFRDTMHNALVRQEYDAAEKLIDTIEKRLGHDEVAAELRNEVATSRQRSLSERIAAAVDRVDALCERGDWGRALREAHRLALLFPDNEQIADLPNRVNHARNTHKRALLTEYSEAVRKNDVDRGIELLRKLDTYLTPQEAAALEESARGVFKERLHTLGVQFSIHVTDGRWSDALATGQQIISEFPNTRMAQEVREKLDLLRSRAGEQGNARA
ncbi:MAG: hypothetical protein KGY99_03940 [Phycisphaerae bacterium]|nr:hypothetical protein [Phycisphaerae bacterium]